MVGALALDDRAAAASLIRWWQDAGVDTLVEEAPRDWLAAAKPLPFREEICERSEAGRGVGSSSPAQVPQPRSPEGDREELPATLPALLEWMRNSADVPEARWGRDRVVATGDPKSDLMIMIDAPDGGELIGGETGALFDRMLQAIGRDRSSIWLAPFATVRPVGRVSQDALRRLTAIARHHIGLVAPKRLLIMGDTPSRALLGTEVIPARGKYHSLDLGTANVEAVATVLPRLLLDRPSFKAQAWKDLQLVMEGL
jgi:DNA polymerase